MNISHIKIVGGVLIVKERGSKIHAAELENVTLIVNENASLKITNSIIKDCNLDQVINIHFESCHFENNTTVGGVITIGGLTT